MKKTLTIEGDITVVTHRPSPGFDPLTASVAEQVANGFPPILDDPPHRERYARMWQRLKNKFRYVEPTFRLEHDRKHGVIRQRHSRAGTQTSTNWSGVVVNPPTGQTFKSVQGDWVIPAVDAPTQNKWYYSATWIGIDGDGSNDVFQAGVESDIFTNGSPVINCYPWWEWYPGDSVSITNFPVSPGDMITMVLSSGGAGSTTGTVYWTNVTTGASTNVTLKAPSRTKLIGNCAEWIVEAPQVGSSQSSLADYGEVFFSLCEATTDNGTTVNGGTGDTIDMTAGGATVSDGIVITPTIIQCQYVGTKP
jgi:Peptidase A4 family